MAKLYNYMKNHENWDFATFGTIVHLQDGYVETSWKIPRKYLKTVGALDWQGSEFLENMTADWDGIMIELVEDRTALRFTEEIDYTDLIVPKDKTWGSDLDYVNNLIEARNLRVSEACQRVLTKKEIVTDYIRGLFYQKRSRARKRCCVV